MKVGTDACLFGAWLHPLNAATCLHALEIGAGTGVLSLMLAQRFPHIEVDAVEIDEAAAIQAASNFAASPWANRLRVIREDILQFNQAKKYSFIFSNPPFFQKSLKSPDTKINLARHESSLDTISLLRVITGNLNPGGSFAVLLPFDQKDNFIMEAANQGWFITSELWVTHSPRHQYARSMLQFCREKRAVNKQTLEIYQDDKNYSPAFRHLLKAYYLFL